MAGGLAPIAVSYLQSERYRECGAARIAYGLHCEAGKDVAAQQSAPRSCQDEVCVLRASWVVERGMRSITGGRQPSTCGCASGLLMIAEICV